MWCRGTSVRTPCGGTPLEPIRSARRDCGARDPRLNPLRRYDRSANRSARPNRGDSIPTRPHAAELERCASQTARSGAGPGGLPVAPLLPAFVDRTVAIREAWRHLRRKRRVREAQAGERAPSRACQPRGPCQRGAWPRPINPRHDGPGGSPCPAGRWPEPACCRLGGGHVARTARADRTRRAPSAHDRPTQSRLPAVGLRLVGTRIPMAIRCAMPPSSRSSIGSDHACPPGHAGAPRCRFRLPATVAPGTASQSSGAARSV